MTRITESVLALPAEEKIKYFEQRTVIHPFFIQAKSELLHKMREPSGPRIIFVIGPSGVGKSHFIKKVIDDIVMEESQLMLLRPDYIPVIDWEIEASSTKNISWKSFFYEGFLLLNQSKEVARKKITPKLKSNIGTTSDLRRIFQTCAKNRGVKWMILDEAQHFKRALSGVTAQDNLDCLKSLANTTGCQIILIGTYELTSLLFHSAQLSRRSKIIHFPRYNILNCNEELNQFKTVIETFEYFTPTIDKPDLLTYWDFLYEKTIGCVGILKDWLKLALSLSLKENSSTLDFSHLEKTAMRLKECARMLKEAEEGEALLFESSTDRNNFKAKLGLAAKNEETFNTEGFEELQAVKAKHNPFKRKSGRDKIGMNSI